MRRPPACPPRKPCAGSPTPYSATWATACRTMPRWSWSSGCQSETTGPHPFLGVAPTITPLGRSYRQGWRRPKGDHMSTAPLPRRVRKISYSAARRMTLVTGLVILVGLAAVLYFTRVDTIEVVAVLFYLPVFVAFMTWGVPGGLVAGAAAAGAYVALRYPSLNAIRGRDLLSLLLGRALGYVAFGAIGGWASRVLQGSILKLNLYDTVDDDTGLLNARQFAIEGHRQIERGQRYGTTFSLTSVQVDDAALIRGTGRRGRANLRELGRSVKATVRQVDAAG